MNYYAELFAARVRRLGVDGVAKWFLESFASKPPVPAAGAFHHDEDEFFVFIFAQRMQYFDTEAKAIVKEAIGRVVEKYPLDGEDGTWEGLYTVLYLAERLEIEHYVEKAAEAFEKWLPIDENWFLTEPSALPKTDNEIFFLRETLESALRFFMRVEGEGSLRYFAGIRKDRQAQSLRRISQWARGVLEKHPSERRLVPAWAPILVFACVDLELGSREWKRHVNTLKRGFRTADEPFPGFFTFKSTENSKFYPYNVDLILNRIEEWMRPGWTKVSAHEWSIHVSVSPLEGNPFEQEKGMAVTGGGAPPVSALDDKEELCGPLKVMQHDNMSRLAHG